MDFEFNKNLNRVHYLILAVAVLLLVFSGGYFYGKASLPAYRKVEGVKNQVPPEKVEADFNQFWKVWSQLEESYYNPENLKSKQMVQGAINGMVESVSDPYTEYMNPETSESFEENISGSFEGIGAEIGKKEGDLTVISPLEDSPADRAGLQSGDRILKVEGKKTEGWTLQKAVNKIRGPKGSTVVLTIVRDSQDPKQIDIVRDEIEMPVISLDFKENNIAHLQIHHFTENSPQLFREKAQEILNSDVNKLVLDLRNNPGGYLKSATEIAGWFLEREKTVTIEHFGTKEDKHYRAQGPALLKDFELVVLINKGSASASEILAAALRHHRGSKIVGETSYGKGTVQTLKRFDNGASLKVTIAEWLTPSEDSISDKGVAPDFKVKIEKKDLNSSTDPQLQKALEILK